MKKFILIVPLALVLFACSDSSLPEGASAALNSFGNAEIQTDALALNIACGQTTAYITGNAAALAACIRAGGGPAPVPAPTLVPWCAAPSGYTKIRTAADLQNIGSSIENLSKNYYLCNDILLNGSFQPIKDPNPEASDAECAENNTHCPIPFTGIFEGNYKAIQNLNISGNTNVGLFARIGSSAEVRNLTLLVHTVWGNQNVGALAGQSGGKIINCSVTNYSATGSGIVGNSLVGQGIWIGGLVGGNWGGKIENSSASGNLWIIGDENVGGLAGNMIDTEIIHSYVLGSVGIQGDDNVGGLVGLSWGFSEIRDSFINHEASVSASQYNLGGLVGKSFDQLLITKSRSSVDLNASHSGGLVGYATVIEFDTGLTIIDSYSEGNIGGWSQVGGLVGYLNRGSITNSYSRGRVAAISQRGGIVGFDDGQLSSISNSYFNRSINTQFYSDPAGRTELQLKTLSTFLPAWNISYIGDSAQTIRKIASPDGTDFPRLAWELQ